MHALTLLPRFREAKRAMDVLASRERWPRGDIEAFQLDRLNRVWAHAARHVPHYRDLSRLRRLPTQFTSLAEFSALVPVLEKSVLRQTPLAIQSERPDPGRWRYTGGSTGTATRVFVEHAAHRAALHSKYRHAQMWGVDILDRCAFLWGHGASFVPGWRGQLAKARRPFEDALRNRLRLSAYDLSPDTLKRHLRDIARFRPASIYAYSTAAYLLAQQALADGFGCDSMKYVLLTSERVFPRAVDVIQRAFGVPAIAEYGSIECGVMASEWTDRRLHVREDAVLLETEQMEDGRFDMLVTVLNNPSFPLLRYRIGDVTDEAVTFPGRGFALMSPIAGRDNDIVLTRTGRPMHPFWFDDVFENAAGVRRWQVAQSESGDVTVTLEGDPSARPIDADRIVALITRHLEGYPVRLSVVDRIAQNAAGKHRWVSSALFVRSPDSVPAGLPHRAA